MKEQILKMLSELKAQKISASTIETELGFSNGLLGKAAKGDTNLSEEKFAKLKSYYEAFFPKPEQLPVVNGDVESIPKTKMVISETGGLKLKPSDEKMKKIRETMDKVNKDFGAGTVMFLGENPNIKVEVISSGSIGLDEALGVGGFPKGRIVEIYGPESSGKTTIAIHAIAEAQKKGLKCMIIDAEHAFDPGYAKNLGVNLDQLIICQPDNGEQGLEVADRHIISGEIGLMVIDSVAALIPKGELEGEMGDNRMGAHARLMSQACRKMTATISKTDTICIFINQLRNKIGIVYGSPEVTTGGMALQFYASIRLDVRRKAKIMDGEETMGNKTTVKVVKNKVAPPFKMAEFDILYGEGIDRTGEVIDAAVSKNIIAKNGSWFSYNGDKLGQGRESVRQLLKDNPEMCSKIEAQLSIS